MVSLRLIKNTFKKAQQILEPYSGGNNHNAILLISDGKETCGGDPIGVAREIKDYGLNIEAHVIGFDVSGADEAQLREIAVSGGGEYYSVKKLQILTKRLHTILHSLHSLIVQWDI